MMNFFTFIADWWPLLLIVAAFYFYDYENARPSWKFHWPKRED